MVVKRLRNLTELLPLKLSKVFNTPLILEKDDKKSGTIAWGGLALGIIAYDIYAIKSKKIETLTRAFWRHTENKITGSIFTGVWLGLTFHLLIEKLIRKNFS
jgi:hypothetical protein